LLGKELWEIGLIKDERSSRGVFRELQEKGEIRYEDLPLQSKSGAKREVVANRYQEDGSRTRGKKAGYAGKTSNRAKQISQRE